MRTAVILLAIIGVLSFIATLLPQRALQPARAVQYIQSHPGLGPFLDRLGMFAVYESWPLIGAATLMYISLSNCVFTRSRALWRRWRRGLPRGPQFIGEAGSLVFHLSFFVLLAGILYGKAFGFTAFVDVIAGQSVVEARPSYDAVEEGLFFTQDQHRGYEVRVDSFNASYYDSGKPKDFVSHVEVFDQGRRVMEKDVRVNQYLEYRGIKFYQASYGWAPEVKVTAPDGRVVFDAPVVFFGDPTYSNGVVKIPAAGPPPNQMAARMFFVPDLLTTPDGATPGTASPNNPALNYLFFLGDLHAQRAQNVYDLDVTRMQESGRGVLFLGDTAVLPNGFKVSFLKLSRYTGLQVTDDPGVPIIWVSFVLMLGGLMIRLYLRPLLDWRSRRR
jgi:cytochrome c biogenesis protein